LKKGGSREKGGGGNEIHAPCACAKYILLFYFIYLFYFILFYFILFYFLYYQKL
jgi:hypothetical protein